MVMIHRKFSCAMQFGQIHFKLTVSFISSLTVGIIDAQVLADVDLLVLGGLISSIIERNFSRSLSVEHESVRAEEVVVLPVEVVDDVTVAAVAALQVADVLDGVDGEVMLACTEKSVCVQLMSKNGPLHITNQKL